MSDIDIVDQIDALVDEQLANYDNRSGYDHSVNQERCRCGRDWHGLPITKRIDSMRSYGEFDPGYVYAEDDSPVMCVGSNTPGPWRQVGMWQLPDDPFAASGRFDYYQAAARHVQRLVDRMDSGYEMPTPPSRPGVNFTPDSVVSISNGNGSWTRIGTIDRIAIPDGPPADFSIGWTTSPPDQSWRFSRELNPRFTPENLPEDLRRLIFGDCAETEPDTRTPQQRALPQPSTTPPMWANDVTRSRRPRRNRNQPNRQGIA